VARYFLLALLLLIPVSVSAASVAVSNSSLPNPVVMVIVLGALSLAPFVVIMLTSFVKISVVLSILRNALGTQSAPPNQVITGLALILSIFVMSPVVRSMYEQAGSITNTRDMFSEDSVKSVFDAVQRGKEPLRQFLEKHAHNPDRILFMELAARLDNNQTRAGSTGPVKSSDTPASPAPNQPIQPNAPSNSTPPGTPAVNPATSVGKEDFQVLIPSFVTSQLKEAFQIGFLIFVPFIVIDMVIANVLLAMGMSMLSPSVISLPFKLLLFILVDGWFLIVRGLVLSYA
jgi:type III secretion protein R